MNLFEIIVFSYIVMAIIWKIAQRFEYGEIIVGGTIVTLLLGLFCYLTGGIVMVVTNILLVIAGLMWSKSHA